jgi:DNA invertase Pin-like site-specific DNA recombinase
MTKPPEKSKVVRKLRCAVYTRKSSEEGLEQEFNSLHAQREACEAYIASQRSEGWVLVRDQYDDGGISGGTLERPGLKRLLEDIEDGLVDVVVVYKIDRLSRSLADFAKLVEVFDRNGVTFVSVTQSFNTTTSMGRLTLNILLLRPVRARGDGRTHPRQGRRQPQEGHVDGRGAALRLPGREPEAGHRRRSRRARALDLRPLPRDRVLHGTGAGGRHSAASARRAATGSTRNTSTGCSTTAPTSARRSTRARAIPASTTPSSTARRGTGPRHPAGEPAQARRPHPRRHARAAEGAAVRAGWRGVLADAHAQGRQALPLLRQPDGAEAWRRIVPGRPRARGRDRGRRHRPAARRVPPARDRGGDVEGGARPRRRHHRGRRPARPCSSSTRCGTNSSPPSRRASWRCWSSAWTSARTG